MAGQVETEDHRRQKTLDVIGGRRNPYLVDYEEQLRLRREMGREPRRRMAEPERTNRRREENFSQESRARRQAKRRRIVRRQRIAVGLWLACILLLSFMILSGNLEASSEKRDDSRASFPKEEGEVPAQSGSVMIQGLPADVFDRHPAWTEDFLTTNEYSRPGDALEEVESIFVHYTANPGTSAAQNRSYFEQQKDTHERSVSAHFIIGYEGEILQCIPLNEIAYAVQTRNFDSVSIECCYLEKDGSFTQETYDALISLLAWLADAYDLDTDDILRHYDCGGKKCPLYYTENPSAWEKLKEDVKEMREDS